MACTQGPHAHFCTRVQGLDLSFGHRPPLRLNSIACRYLKKGCVQQVAYSRNMPEHHYSVNAVFLHHFTIRYSSLSRALAPHRLIEGDSSGDPVSSHRVLQLPCLMFGFCQCFWAEYLYRKEPRWCYMDHMSYRQSSLHFFFLTYDTLSPQLIPSSLLKR